MRKTIDLLVAIFALSSLIYAVKTLSHQATTTVSEGNAARLGSPVEGYLSLIQTATPLRPRTSQDTLVIFSDFECPFCRELAHELDSIRVQLGASAPAVYVIHLPLTNIHPRARILAVVAECARSNEGFPSLHDALLQNQRRFLGLDADSLWQALPSLVPGFDFECSEREAAEARVALHIETATELGVTRTPSIILNGRWVEGNPASGLRSLFRGGR